jgi:hypothetical protein
MSERERENRVSASVGTKEKSIMNRLGIHAVALLIVLLPGCSSLPSWTGKYKRDDGKFELYSEADGDLVEVTIVKAGGAPADESSVKNGFLAKIKGDRAVEMQLCRNGNCSKECLSSLSRSKEGITYHSCSEDFMDGTYR